MPWAVVTQDFDFGSESRRYPVSELSQLRRSGVLRLDDDVMRDGYLCSLLDDLEFRVVGGSQHGDLALGPVPFDHCCELGENDVVFLLVHPHSDDQDVVTEGHALGVVGVSVALVLLPVGNPRPSAMARVVMGALRLGGKG